MKAFLVCLLNVACLCFLVGCGGGGKSSSPSMSGHWTFSSIPTGVPFPAIQTATGTLTQNGSSVTGTLTLAGFACAKSGALTGTVSGNTLSLQLDENGQSVTFTGRLNSTFDSASGSYIAPSGGCTNGDSGLWTATKG